MTSKCVTVSYAYQIGLVVPVAMINLATHKYSDY